MLKYNNYNYHPRKSLSTSAPPQLTMFPWGDNLPCLPVKNVIFIL